MATKQLFQILLKNRDGIKQGITKVQDIVTEYLSTTGARAISPDERFTINKEFSELAPSNVVNDIFGDFQGLQKDAGDVVTDTPFTNKIREQNPDVEIRGNETFGELIEKLGKPIDSTSLKDNLMQTDNPFSDLVKTTEKGPKTLDQRRADAIKELGLDKGVGSLYPKGKAGEIFDEANSKRDEMAAFMKAMRDAGIKNEDVMKTAKITDVAEGKRAATTLARAADMGADTKIKQELLGTLDEDVATNGPRFFQEEFMGYDSMGNLLENITTTVNNGIYDDLIEQGVPEDKVSEIFRYISSVRNNMKYDPKAVLRKIADDIEMEDIKYDTTFWDNYIDEILTRIQKTRTEIRGRWISVMAIIQDIVNFVPSWQKHLDESGYLKAPGQTDYHQKAGYNFKENFPNTPGYVADALGKAYQYGTEGIGSFFSGSSFPDAMARAKEESRLNSLGFRGQGFNMDEYNQTMDFARKGFDQNKGLTYGAAQASDLTNLERDFPGMSTGDIIDSMNNRQRANRFSGMGQMGPNKSNMNAPAALDMDRFAGVSNLGRNDMDVEQVEQLGSPSRFQGFKNQMSNFMDNPVTRGLGTALNFARGSLPGMIMSGIGSLFSRNPNAPSYQTRSPNIDYSNLNTTNLNDFYDSNPDSDTFGTTRFDRAVPGSFGSFRTLAGYLNRNKTAAAALTTKKAKKEAAMQQQIKDAEARQAVLAARQAAANRSGVGYRSSRDHSGSGGYGGSDKRSADNRSSDLGFSDIRLKDNIELVGKSPSDINIYNFTYLNDPKVYQGVMAQEVPWASVEHNSGYLMVDYSKVDVEFKRKDAVASMFTRRG